METTNEVKYYKPDSFISIPKTPLSYGFISATSKLKFFNNRTGKLIELEELHNELSNLTVEERIAFWKYLIMRDLYLELMKDPQLKTLPLEVRSHVSKHLQFKG